MLNRTRWISSLSIHPVIFESTHLKVSAISKSNGGFLDLRGDFLLEANRHLIELSAHVRSGRTKAILSFRNPKRHEDEV